jgi:ribonuclease R
VNPKPRQSRSALPGKDEILKFIKSQPKRVGKRDIARAFKIKGNSKIGLKRLLREMADEGLIAKSHKRLVSAAHLPPVGVLEIKRQNDDGDLVAEPANWDYDKSPYPPLVVIVSARSKHGSDVAGVGDRVLARIEKVDEEPVTYEARIIKRLGQDQTTLLGVFKAAPDGSGLIEPIDKKQRNILVVPAGSVGGAETGDLVSVEVTRKKAYGPAQAQIKSTLGRIDSHRSASRIAIATYDIPDEFPEAVIKQAQAQTAPDLKGREDLRELPLITIDPSDARDHDDAVHAQMDSAPDNPGGFIVTVAIADVAAHVAPGSALDTEAKMRGNSVYFPDCVVPMLPEALSNDLCSLRPDEDRPALVCRMIFDAEGNKRHHEFIHAMIKSHAKLSYQQAQDAIDGKGDEATNQWLEPVLKHRKNAARWGWICLNGASFLPAPVKLKLWSCASGLMHTSWSRNS